MQVLFGKYFVYDWIFDHFHTISYLTELCVFRTLCDAYYKEYASHQSSILDISGLCVVQFGRANQTPCNSSEDCRPNCSIPITIYYSYYHYQMKIFFLVFSDQHKNSPSTINTYSRERVMRINNVYKGPQVPPYK